MEWTAGIFLLGVVLIIMALFSWGKARKKQSGSNVTAREHLERVKQKQHVRSDMQDLMVEIEQMAKRLGAHLDAKTIHIEKAIREADERIAQLEALRASSPSAAASAAEEVSAEVESAALALPADASAVSEVLAEVPEAEAPADEPYTDPLMGRVYALADAGKGPQAIAQELQEQVGKVELILALRSA
ncbi:hypothetical protein OT109_05845 [Phycisphaeraceae bacterium D3-23]